MSNGTRQNGSWGGALLTLAAAFTLSLGAGAAPAQAAGCTKVAATGGSDSGAGTAASPYLSAQKLVDSLKPGETGCLRAGTYSGNVKISRSGAAGAPLVLTSYPGERATVVGKLWIPDSANFVTVASLDLDGRNAANASSPAISGDDVTFVDNDVTNHHTSICFSLGPTTYGRAYRTVIERNRIHDCGSLPATNLDHGIYVEHATGARIVDNQVYDNADRAINLYPDAQGSYVARNVMDGNGEGVLFGGGAEEYGPQASNDNVVELNLITNSTQRYNVEAYWGAGIVGQRNVVRKNCIFGGARDVDNHGLSRDPGFDSAANVLADPGYANRGGKNFTLTAGSPCRDLEHTTGNPASAVHPQIVLTSPATAAQPGQAVPLRGHVTADKRPTHVTLRVKRGKRWKKVGRARVRKDGRFSTKPRLRSRRRGRGSPKRLRLRRATLSRRVRTIELRADAPGTGRSNTVRLRVSG